MGGTGHFRWQGRSRELDILSGNVNPGASTKFLRGAARKLIRLYQLSLSPLVGMNCRHMPTCSHYADESIALHGVWAGGWMTLARLLRCQPFGSSGLDFVPRELPRGSRWYLPWRYARWSGTNAVPPQ
jgi:putative membrane protein insertion efficiency factor